MSKSEYTTEMQAQGKYDVVYNGYYPKRIGYITGAKSTWLAERGLCNLGYFKTKKAALQAIINEFERPLTQQEADNWNNNGSPYINS